MARLPAAERRVTIERAAAELFAKHGYGATSIDDIAHAAGVTKPIVYRHFASKRELHLALLAAHRDGLLSCLTEAWTHTSENLDERVLTTLHAWLGYLEQEPFAARLLFYDTTGEAQAIHIEMRAAARAAIVALLRAESRIDIDVQLIEPTAELIRAGLVGLALWWSEHPALTRAQIATAASHVIWQGLAPRDAGHAGRSP